MTVKKHIGLVKSGVTNDAERLCSDGNRIIAGKMIG